MFNKSLSLLCIILVSSLLSNCGSDGTTPINESETGVISIAPEVEGVIEDIRDAGGEVVYRGIASSMRSTFGVDVYSISVGNDGISIMVYENNTDASLAVNGISSDGETITIQQDDGSTFSITLSNTPHFYSSDNLIILYMGDTPEVTLILEQLYGQQFAGGTSTSQCLNVTEEIQAFPVENREVSLNADQFRSDVEFISQARPMGSDHYLAVQALCSERLASLGFEVEHHDYGSGTNIIGVKQGVKSPNRRVLLSAHYDAVDSCPGADDNASGIAGVLEAARILSLESHDKTLVVACWDEEEKGKLGSTAYATREKEADKDIEIAFVFEMIGYTSNEENSQSLPPGIDLRFPDEIAKLADNKFIGDFILTVSDEDAGHHRSTLSELAVLNELPIFNFELTCIEKNDEEFANLQRSDHSSFWQQHYPSIMLTDTANYRNPYYHCGSSDASDLDDIPEHLNYEFGMKVIKVTTLTIEEALIDR
ncbi:MAG: M20/M25/M40 family metallo-hydrolase [Pseudomonadales bacterium]|nr:M20/M25/M40 family metallo-hydrolase [Pseudomonadales bacterium]